MRLRIIRVLSEFNGRLDLGRGHYLHDPQNLQAKQPVRASTTVERATGLIDPAEEQFWSFRNRLVLVEDPDAHLEEIELSVKHEVLDRERRYAEMRRDVELLEKGESLAVVRVPISREVRVLVWRRDRGRCTACGSCEQLEFDHIIPLAKGGSSTERNIQLLCENCNRSKSASI